MSFTTLQTIVHQQTVCHNYTQSPTASHNTINLHSPTIFTYCVSHDATNHHAPAIYLSQLYTVTYCLSQYYKPPLTYYIHLLSLSLRYKPSCTCNLFVTTIQSPTAFHNTINLHSPTIFTYCAFHDATNHYSPTICLSQLFAFTYYLLQYYKPPLTYYMPVTTLQTSTGPKCPS